MKKNDLNQPLERPLTRESARERRPLVAPLLVIAALFLAVVAAFWVAVVDDPDGGRPVVVAKIEDAVPTATGSVAAGGRAAETGEAAPAGAAALSPTSPPQQAGEMQLAALPQLPPPVGGDPSLVEHSRFGPLPRVSPDGRRPREAYAGRSAPVPAGVARVVIVVGGLGLSQTGTQAALEKLPPDVTLAFAPYGSSLQRWVGKARENGHEVLLQIPLEPMDYPAVNPGEHTLLVSGGAERITSYTTMAAG